MDSFGISNWLDAVVLRLSVSIASTFVLVHSNTGKTKNSNFRATVNKRCTNTSYVCGRGLSTSAVGAMVDATMPSQSWSMATWWVDLTVASSSPFIPSWVIVMVSLVPSMYIPTLVSFGNGFDRRAAGFTWAAYNARLEVTLRFTYLVATLQDSDEAVAFTIAATRLWAVAPTN